MAQISIRPFLNPLESKSPQTQSTARMRREVFVIDASILQTVVLSSPFQLHTTSKTQTLTTCGYEISPPVFALSYDEIYTLHD